MIHLRRIAILTIALLAAALPGYARDVSGGISGTDVWRLEDSPIRVVGDVAVSTGSRLDIEPGVTVAFAGPYSLTVMGSLGAVGTSAARILFTAEDPGVDSLRWRGLRFINASPDCKLTFCRVEYSWARGEWPNNNGGGIYMEGSSPSIIRCEIVNNRADGDGGGIYGWFTTADIINDVLALNFSLRFGGGIFIDYSSPNILNCTIAHDTATAWGGGIYAGSGSTPVIKNCIINFNIQRDKLDGQSLGADNPFFPNLANAHGAKLAVTFCDIGLSGENPFHGSGNILGDPQFLNDTAEPYDFHLAYSSPCVDAGDPLMPPGNEPDVLINRLDMGAYGGTNEATLSVPVINVPLFNLGVALTYDSMRTGAQSSQEIRVENLGHYRLYLNEFRFSSPDFYSDSAQNDAKVLVPAYKLAPIEPGESQRYNINFRPDSLITYQDTLWILSSDSINSAPFLRLGGTGIDPVAETIDSLQFGRQQMGATHRDSLYVHNVGRSQLRLRSSSIQGSGFEITLVSQLVNPGDSGKVRVGFTPTFPQFYSAYATINTNDQPLAVTLTGWGVGPKMKVDEDSLFIGYAYGDPAVGDTISQTVAIQNEGADSLLISRIQISDPAFSVELPPGGLAIADSGKYDLRVYFHPTRPNSAYIARMVISSNYPQPDTVRLTGQGMARPGRYMFGHVEGLWDWSPGSADYIVLDSVYVASDARLKIAAGARVLFEPGAFLQADGEIHAAGEQDDSVYFLPRDNSGSDAGRWGGVRLSLKDGTRLSHCVIRGSRQGIRITESSPIVQFCTVSANGDTARDGGGIYIENSGASISGCTIEDNKARHGAGVCVINSVPSITNCIIRGNEALEGGGAYMRFLAGTLMQSDLIYNNRGGGVVIREHSAPRLVNNTIVENFDGGVAVAVRSIPVLVNNIIWNNGGAAIELADNANALVSYCDIAGGFTGTENLDADPKFVGTGDQPYYLADSSPLIDRGNPELSYRDFFFPPSRGTERSDIGAYGGPLSGNWESPELEATVYQNPAFHQWLDVLITALDTFPAAPVCSVQVSGGSAAPLALSQLGATTYRGSYEAATSGTLFLTVDADLASGHRKIGRTYDLIIAGSSGGGGYVQSIGFAGRLEIPKGALTGTTAIALGSGKAQPVSSDGVMFLSRIITVTGLTGAIQEPVNLNLAIDGCAGWSKADKMGLYHNIGQSWLRMDGNFRNGVLRGELVGDGEYAIGWDESYHATIEPIPGTARLIAAYPNPFNGMISLTYEMPTAGAVTLIAYDLAGREVARPWFGDRSAGRHTDVWNGADFAGRPLPAGIYWLELIAGTTRERVKVLLLK